MFSTDRCYCRVVYNIQTTECHSEVLRTLISHPVGTSLKTFVLQLRTTSDAESNKNHELKLGVVHALLHHWWRPAAILRVKLLKTPHQTVYLGVEWQWVESFTLRRFCWRRKSARYIVHRTLTGHRASFKAVTAKWKIPLFRRPVVWHVPVISHWNIWAIVFLNKCYRIWIVG